MKQFGVEQTTTRLAADASSHDGLDRESSGIKKTSLSRREALRRAALFAGLGGLPFSYSAASDIANGQINPWPNVDLKPISAPGYGTDPDLLHPSVPWPNTLTEAQLQTVSTLADILIPAEDEHPAASALGVPQVLDEWISAPYPAQRQHRTIILSGLVWIEQEAQRRFDTKFTDCKQEQQLSIIDDIAHPGALTDPRFTRPAEFFDGMRRLVVGFYYTTPQGTMELGYLGNVPIAGDYPGPSDLAMRHLTEKLAELDLLDE